MTSSRATQLALVFDDLWTRDDPDIAQDIATIVAAVPVQLRDQLDAAASQVMATALDVMRGRNVHATHPADTPAWLRLSALTTLAQWLLDEGATCIHAPSPTRPQPVAAAAWRPGLVVCGGCTHLFRLAEGSVADRTCDACGHIAAGSTADDPIFPGVMIAGALAFTYGVCGGCYRDCLAPATR